MNQIFNIQDNKVIVNELVLSKMEGPSTNPVEFNCSIEVTGSISITDTLKTNTLHVKNLITDNGPLAALGEWAGITESDINGKGFSWTHGTGAAQLMYRTGNRIWTNANIDLHPSSSYNIDNIPVITSNSLGSSIVSSNLRKVGPLNSLTVIGDANIGEFVFVDTTSFRVGIGTEEPNASLSIIDNNVELGFGSPEIGLGHIGTYSNHTFDIVTDGTSRVSIKNNGAVHIGNAERKNGELYVHGTLYADNIISDTRIERSTPIEFVTTQHNSVYGKGLLWTGNGETKYLTLEPNPDRVYCSVPIGLSNQAAYFIGDNAVLSKTVLGPTVQESSLTSVGILNQLRVAGQTELDSITTNNIVIGDDIATISLSGADINASDVLSLSVANQRVLNANKDTITIGSDKTKAQTVKIIGNLSIGVNNPDPSVDLTVKGDISFANKKFSTGTTPPISGVHTKSDICWNSNPTPNGVVGWICVASGAPGIWNAFGNIHT